MANKLKEGWKKEFDEKFVNLKYYHVTPCKSAMGDDEKFYLNLWGGKIKDFIESQLEKEKKKYASEVLDEIEEITKKEYENNWNMERQNDDVETFMANISDLINSKRKELNL